MRKKQGGPTIADVMEFLETKVMGEIYGLKERLERLEKNNDYFNQRFERLEQNENGVKRRLDGLEQDMDHLKQGQYSLVQEMTEIKNLLIVIEKQTSEDARAYAGEIVSLKKRVSKLEKDVVKIKARR